MATVSVDYATFKTLVGALVGATVFYAPAEGKSGFQAMAVAPALTVVYSGDDPATFAIEFPAAVKVLNVYP